MNKEELLEYAIKMYPIGTRFYPIRTDTLKPSENDDYKVINEPHWIDNVICANGNIYVEGIWAPIICYPGGNMPDKVVNSFPIY